MKDNILFLGVGVDQLPAIKTAIELDLGILGLDGNPMAVGAEYCDAFETVDISNPDTVEPVALRLNKQYGIDGVMALAVDVGPSVGRVVDKLGLLGISEATAFRMTDKIKRREALDEAGIPQPRWAYRDEKKAGLWKIFPCVVKPRNKSAAQGVRLVDNFGEVGLNYDMLEEYLEGWEISTEVLVKPDQSFIAINADRNYDKKLKWKPYLLEDGCQLPSKLPPKMQTKINTTVRKLIDYFNIKSCVMKLDLLIKNNIVYVIECAPRLGGGKLSSQMIPMVYNQDYWKCAIKLAMGRPIYETFCKPLAYCAQRYKFPENPQSHRDRLGSVECIGDTYESAIEKAEQEVLKA